MNGCPNSALTIKQEEHVLDWILARQKEQNCPCPREVREYGARLKNASQGIIIVVALLLHAARSA